MNKIPPENIPIGLLIKGESSQDNLYILRDLSGFYGGKNVSITSKSAYAFFEEDKHLTLGIDLYLDCKKDKSLYKKYTNRKGLPSVSFQKNKFETYHKLSLYDIHIHKYSQFSYIISDEKYPGKYNVNSKSVEILPFSRIEGGKPFLVSKNNHKDNKELFLDNKKYVDYESHILPVFFLEGENYYFLDSQGKLLGEQIFDRRKGDPGVQEIIVPVLGKVKIILFPSKGLDGLVDDIFYQMYQYNFAHSKSYLGLIKSKQKQKNTMYPEQFVNKLLMVLRKLQSDTIRKIEDFRGNNSVNKIKKVNSSSFHNIIMHLPHQQNNLNFRETFRKMGDVNISYSKTKSILDNPLNRIVKFILIELQSLFPISQKHKYIHNEISELLKILHDVKDISLEYFIQKSPFLSNHKTYFELFTIYKDICHYQIGIGEDIANSDNYLGKITEYYEAYCFEIIKEILKEKKINFSDSESKVIQKVGKKLEYIRHEKFIKFQDNTSSVKGFLEVIKDKKYRLIFGDVYNKKTTSKNQDDKLRNFEKLFYYNRSQVLSDSQKERNKLSNEIQGNSVTVKENYLYPKKTSVLNFSESLGKEFCFHNKSGDYMIPDISLEVRNLENNGIENLITFDVKFSAFFDGNQEVSFPRKGIFKEIQKYRKIGYEENGEFKPFSKNPIIILYPGNISDDNLFRLINYNNIIRNSYNVIVFPIHDKLFFQECSELKKYIIDTLKSLIFKSMHSENSEATPTH